MTSHSLRKEGWRESITSQWSESLGVNLRRLRAIYIFVDKALYVDEKEKRNELMIVRFA